MSVKSENKLNHEFIVDKMIFFYHEHEQLKPNPLCYWIVSSSISYIFSDCISLFICPVIDIFSQMQLRAFIPTMLKYSCGRGQPGWGDLDKKPCWWPDTVPWANVRSDSRSDEEKAKVPVN